MGAFHRSGRFLGPLIAASFVLALPSISLAAGPPFIKPSKPLELSAKITASSNYVTGTATIQWHAPLDTGSNSIGAYTVTVSGLGSHGVSGTTLKYSIGGLTLGHTYTVSVTATNKDDMTSDPAAISYLAVWHPSPPSGLSAMFVSVSGGNANIQIGWDGPAFTGGSGITGYSATASPANKTCSVPSANNSCNLALPLGSHQIVTVVAKNAFGSSPQSAPISFTAPNVPGAPSGLTATIQSWKDGKATVTLSWFAPASSGGRPILGYDATFGNNLLSCSTAGTLTCQVVGVAPGDYTPKVTAKNMIGTSPAASITFTVPTAPPPTPTPAATPTPAPTDSPVASESAEPSDAGASPAASDDGTTPGSTDQGGGSGIDPLLVVFLMAAAIVIGAGAALAFVWLRGRPAPGGLAGHGGEGGSD